MTIDSGVIIARTPAATGTQEHHSYLDWAAIIGGIVLASAISLLLLTFGSAVGLSFANFHNCHRRQPDLGRHRGGQLAALGADLELHGRRLPDRPHAPALPRCHRA